MSKPLRRCTSILNRALQSLVQHSVGILSLLGVSRLSNRMSWTFGIKPRASSGKPVKEKDVTDKAIDKLQAYHKLAEVAKLVCMRIGSFLDV